MSEKNNSGFLPAEILLPKNVDMEKWSVVACDQFSSERDYWERVGKFIGESPSTLHMIIPEAYLEDGDQDTRAKKINRVMQNYLDSGVFSEPVLSYIYIERQMTDGSVRRGLVGMLDLEEYDYTPGSTAKIRASEKTIIERLPPRIEVRRGAPVELPHIMALINDSDKTVIEPLAAETDKMEKVYDFELVEGGGHIKGWRASGAMADKISQAVRAYEDKTDVNIIIGDGNHSLAAAKGLWNEIKENVPESERKNHPARYALVELNNVYDPAIQFEAIHRVLFAAGGKRFIDEFSASLTGVGSEKYDIQWVTKNESGTITVEADSIGGMIGIVQRFIDEYVEKNGCTVDYIHGEDATKNLGTGDGCVGLVLPSMGKSDFFATVSSGTIFPKKSFSIGHAQEKRYYLECRRIQA